MESPGNLVMYYLTDGPERAFASEELMLILKIQSCPLIMFRNGNGSATGGPGPGAGESRLRDSPHKA